MKTRIFFLALLLLLLLNACSSSGSKQDAHPEDGHITNLYVRYLEKEKQVKAVAEFKFQNEEGRIAKDDSIYKIWFQGRAMNDLSELTGKNYYDLELDHANPGTFEFTIENKNKQVINHSLDLVQENVIEFQQFKKGFGLLVNLNKLVLNEMEELIFVITDGDANSVSTTIKGPSKGVVLITQESFDSLKEGTCMIYPVWKTVQQTELDNGRLLITEREYFFNDSKVQLEKKK
jgi:hypothetical protein